MITEIRTHILRTRHIIPHEHVGLTSKHRIATLHLANMTFVFNGSASPSTSTKKFTSNEEIKNYDAESTRRHFTKAQPSLCNEGLLLPDPDNQ